MRRITLAGHCRRCAAWHSGAGVPRRAWARSRAVHCTGRGDGTVRAHSVRSVSGGARRAGATVGVRATSTGGGDRRREPPMPGT